MKVLANLSKHQANRTQLYKTELRLAQRKYFQSLATADTGSSPTEAAVPALDAPGFNPFIEQEDGAVFRLSIQQMYGLLAVKHGLGDVGPQDAVVKKSGVRVPVAVPDPVKSEVALDVTLDSARWATSAQREKAVNTLARSRTLPLLQPSPKRDVQAFSASLQPPPSREARLYSLPTSIVTDHKPVSRGSAIPAEALDAAALKVFPSPVRVPYRHSCE